MSHNAKEPVRQETMMSPMDFADVGSKMAALIHGVMQTNLRTIIPSVQKVLKPSSPCNTALLANT
jgi:hypothetical protein